MKPAPGAARAAGAGHGGAGRIVCREGPRYARNARPGADHPTSGPDAGRVRRGTHDRLDYLNQLEVIRGLHARRRAIAIGMEQFQQPFQGVLDDYVAGASPEREMLEGTEYFERWRFGYRLLAHRLRYAREHGIPVVALNVPAPRSPRRLAARASGG